MKIVDSALVYSGKITANGYYGLYYKEEYYPSSPPKQLFYLEIVGKVASGTATVALYNGTAYSSLSLSSTSFTTVRSSQSFITTYGDSNYRLSVTGSATGIEIITARVVGVYNFDSNNVVKDPPIVIYQNGTYLGHDSTTSETYIPVTNPIYYKADSSYFPKRAKLIANIQNTYKSSITYAALQKDDGNFSNWTLVTGSEVSFTGIASTYAIVGGSYPFSIESGVHYRLVIKTSSIKYIGYVYAAYLNVSSSFREYLYEDYDATFSAGYASSSLSGDGLYNILKISYGSDRLLIVLKKGTTSSTEIYNEIVGQSVSIYGKPVISKTNYRFLVGTANSSDLRSWKLYKIVNDTLSQIGSEIFLNADAWSNASINDDGTLFAVWNGLTSINLYSTDGSTYTLEHTFSLSAGYGLCLSGDGKYLALSGTTPKVYENTSGSDLTQWTLRTVNIGTYPSGTTYVMAPAISSDGEYVFYIGYNSSNTIYKFYLLKRNPTTLEYDNITSTNLESHGITYTVLSAASTGLISQFMYNDTIISTYYGIFVKVGEYFVLVTDEQFIVNNNFTDLIEHLTYRIWRFNIVENPIRYVMEAFMPLMGSPDTGAGLQNQVYSIETDELDFSGNVKVYMDSDNSSNSLQLYNTTDSQAVANSTITGSNLQISSEITLPEDEDNIDINVLDSTGIIAAAGLMFHVSTLSPPAITLITADNITQVTDFQFRFYAVDFGDNDVEYNFVLYSGETEYINVESSSGSGFTNITTGSDTSPFNSGETIEYIIDNITSGSYYWKIRAKAPNGSGTWSDFTTPRSVGLYAGITPTPISSLEVWGNIGIEREEANTIFVSQIMSQEAFGSPNITFYSGPTSTALTESQTFYTPSPTFEFSAIDFNQYEELEYIIKVTKDNFLDTNHIVCSNTSGGQTGSIGTADTDFLTISENGSRMYIRQDHYYLVGEDLWVNVHIRLLSFSTPWDLSTYSEIDSWDWDWQQGYPHSFKTSTGFKISNDGTKLITSIGKYILSNAWNLDTWGDTATQAWSESNLGWPYSLYLVYMNAAGTIFIFFDQNDSLIKVELSVAWDLSTGTIIQSSTIINDLFGNYGDLKGFASDGSGICWQIYIDGAYHCYYGTFLVSENLDSLSNVIRVTGYIPTQLSYGLGGMVISGEESVLGCIIRPSTSYYLAWRNIDTAKDVTMFELDSGENEEQFWNTENTEDIHPFIQGDVIGFMPIGINKLLTSGSGYEYQVTSYIPDNIQGSWTTAIPFTISDYWVLNPQSISSEESVCDSDNFIISKWNDQFISGVTSGSSLEEFEVPALSFPLMVNPQSIESEEYFQINVVNTTEFQGIVTYDINISSGEAFGIPTVGNKSIAPTIVLNTASGNIATQTPYFEFTGSDTDTDELEYRIKLEYVPGEPYNIANKTLTQSWAFSGYFPQYIKPDGLSVWAIETTNVRKYDLSVANDFTTFGTVQTSSSGISSGRSIRFTDDGLRVFMINASYLYSWQLSVAWDLTTKYNQKSRYVQNGEYTARSIAVDPTGRKVSVICYGGLNGYGGVQTITMSNSWDIESGSISWSGGIQEPESGNYSSDGRYLSTDCYVFWLFGGTNRWVCWYFEIPFDYSTLVQLYEDGGSQDAVIYSSDGQKIFRKASGNIYEYALQSENRSTWLDEYSSSSDDFVNTVNGGDISPFTQAQKIRYTVPEEHKITSSGLFILTIFVKDPNGTNVWVQSGQRRFTSTVAAVISLSPISSEEAFGPITLIYGQDITPVPISSEEAFGTAAVGVQFLVPTSIVSQEAFALAELFPFDERFTGSDYDPWSDSNWIVSVTP